MVGRRRQSRGPSLAGPPTVRSSRLSLAGGIPEPLPRDVAKMEKLGPREVFGHRDGMETALVKEACARNVQTDALMAEAMRLTFLTARTSPSSCQLWLTHDERAESGSMCRRNDLGKCHETRFT
ncbi:hypothetical protein MTO96_020544 [Rhipicephalus appendiculatus]